MKVLIPGHKYVLSDLMSDNGDPDYKYAPCGVEKENTCKTEPDEFDK